MPVPQRLRVFLWVDWVLSNIRSQLSRKFQDLPWPYLFISTLRHLWKGRNDLVFNNVRHTNDVIVHRALTWARYYSESCTQRTPMIPSVCESVTWRQPNPCCICLNVDGAVSMVSNSGAIGGLLQDHSGSWISGFTILRVQSDSKDVITMLNVVQTARSAFLLVRAIAKLRQKRWVTDIVWVPHDGNRAADVLAKLVDPSALDIIELQSPPERLHPILHSDAHEASFAQF
ncbi:hypothetical protein V6N11_028875 [Hibiscus sabdariffa]|uniref:Uncharacterized protein n=2 Tax=Hibiscus sabdariffa TaxID=183260 RepID=A0ABR2B3F2_9ROSI